MNEKEKFIQYCSDMEHHYSILQDAAIQELKNVPKDSPSFDFIKCEIALFRKKADIYSAVPGIIDDFENCGALDE